MKTTLVNLRVYKGTDYVRIDRRTLFGNPFRITFNCDREKSVRLFKTYFEHRIKTDRVFRAAVKALQGKKLGCWCTPKLCHGDIVVEYLNNLKGGE